MTTSGMGATPASTALRALDALRALALEQGLDDVSMRDVARQLGISLAALQYHYPNKASLLEAFVRQTIETYRERIVAVLAACAPGGQLAALVRFATAETLRTDQYRVLAMIEGRAHHDMDARRAIGLFFRSYLDTMCAAIQADRPDLSPRKVLVVAALAVSMLEGLPSVIEPAGELGVGPDALADALVELVQTLAEVTA